MSRDPQTVFIVDDDPNVRDSLAWLLEAADHSARSFDSAEAFLEHIGPNPAGCLLLDHRMAGMNGLSLVDALRDRDIVLPIILLTGYADVPLAVRAMRAGVIDVLEKPYDDKELLRHIDNALRLNREHLKSARRRHDISSRIASLTPRERTVFERVVSGETSKQIAQALGITASTVDVHRSRIMEKFGVSTSAQLVRLALLHAAELAASPAPSPSE